jgi:lipopolysaccharide export system protein LptC
VLIVVLLSRITETPTDTAETADRLVQEDFDYYITGMNNTHFDAMGKPTYKLQAARATHYPETDTAKMENPRFFYFEDDASTWEVTATSGNLGNSAARNEEQLELFDDVVIRRPLEDGSFLVVTTERLDVFPDSKEVNTESPVTLEAKGSHLESTGMRAFLNEEHIDLLSAIKGSIK